MLLGQQIDLSRRVKGILPVQNGGLGVDGPFTPNRCIHTSADGLSLVVSASDCLGASGSGYTSLQNNGSSIAAETIINFLSGSLSCVDNSGQNRSDCSLASTASTTIFNAATGFQVGGVASAGKVLIGDGTNFVPGDPFVQGIHAESATGAVNPIGIGGFDTAGAPAIHGINVINSPPAGTEYAIITRNIPSGTQTISGSVSISNFPATQAISATQLPAALDGSGYLKVHEQGTATISGTVTANAGTGTFNIAASSLPLPTGAATLAKQPALGTAGSASVDVITIQGISGMVAVKVDGSGVTQPISGSVSVSNFPGTQVISGTVTANAGTGTFTVSGTVTSNIGTTGGLALDATLTGGGLKAQGNIASGSSDSGNPIKIGNVFNTTQPTVTNGQRVDGQASARGGLIVASGIDVFHTTIDNASIAVTGTFFQATQPVSIAGTVAVSSTQLPAALDGSGFLKTHEQGTATISGTVTSNQGTAAALSGKWPVVLTDGTNSMPTGDAAARTIHTTLDNASIAVTGTFFQATQPVSWSGQTVTVTQGTGTNLHTVTDSGSVTTSTTNADTTIGGTTAPSKGLLAIGKTNDGTAQYQPLPEGAAGRSVIVEGVAGGTAVPTSLATLPALTAGSAVIGHVITDTNSTTAITGNVTVIQGTGTNLHTVVDSGTVTANAGTNLNTSALALETGGNVATTATNTGTIATNTTGAAKDATLTGGSAKTQITDGTDNAVVTATGALQVATGGQLPGVSGVIPVVVMYGPPALSQQVTSNQLLFRSAMRNYCYQNLCPAR